MSSTLLTAPGAGRARQRARARGARRAALALLPAFSLLLARPASAQLTAEPAPVRSVAGKTGAVTDLSGALVTPDGLTMGRTLAARAADVVNVADYGAKCDGTTDDSGTINAALAAIRARSVMDSYIGHAGRLRLPPGRCLIKSTLNFTGLFGNGFVADLWGTQLLCQTNGTPCIDATGSGHIAILGLNLIGYATNAPNIGLVLARPTPSLSNGADHVFLENPLINGSFTLAAFYNRSSETTHILDAWFGNGAPNAYAAIWDGSNHFNFQSALDGRSYPADTFSSFNENTCTVCIFKVTGAGSAPIWIGGTSRHRFVGSYALNAGGGGTPGVVLSFVNGIGNDFLDLGIHFEGAGLGSVVEITGASDPVMHGLRMDDPLPQQSGPLFLRDVGVSTVTIQDADLRIGRLTGTSARWWDSAAAYTLSGRIYSQDGSYTAPAYMSGYHCLGGSCTSDLPLPANLTVGSVSNPGGVSGFSISAYGNWTAQPAGFGLPTCAIAAPSGGGQQATCHVAAMSIYGFGPMGAAGSGYSVNDVLSYAGGTCTTPPQIKVTAVGSGGAISSWYGSNGGRCTVAPPSNNALTGGTGTGAVMPASSYKIASSADLIVDIAGAGYTVPPAVTISVPSGQSQSYAAAATTTLSGQMSLSAGNGQVLLNGTGTSLGTAGTGGSPVVALGAFIDNSGVRQSLGGTYTVPSNTSLIRFTQTGTVASSTVTLPAALADGQAIQFVNYAGAVTALTFSPAVNGWTNGSTLAAYTGLRIRWDATASAWYREQ